MPAQVAIHCSDVTRTLAQHNDLARMGHESHYSTLSRMNEEAIASRPRRLIEL